MPTSTEVIEFTNEILLILTCAGLITVSAVGLGKLIRKILDE